MAYSSGALNGQARCLENLVGRTQRTQCSDREWTIGVTQCVDDAAVERAGGETSETETAVRTSNAKASPRCASSRPTGGSEGAAGRCVLLHPRTHFGSNESSHRNRANRTTLGVKSADVLAQSLR
jgi:hypothetical protein